MLIFYLLNFEERLAIAFAFFMFSEAFSSFFPVVKTSCDESII